MLPQQTLAVTTLLAAHTVGGALQMQDSTRGTITVGGVADFVIVDRDVPALSAEQIYGTRVLSTWLAGRKVWPTGDASSAATRQQPDHRH